MFTGIIEYTGRVEEVIVNGLNKTFRIVSPISSSLKVDQSVAHSGVCLTIESISDDSHTVTAVEETLKKTCLHQWQPGTVVNIERCMLMNGRLDGHIVQGHVDDVAVCTSKTDCNGSWEFILTFNEKFAHLVIEKGSICINGVSLTCFNITRNSLQVAIVPYTYLHTNMQHIEVGTTVNIEFDVLGKYISRMHELNKQ
jgi:riboflavin synthase